MRNRPSVERRFGDCGYIYDANAEYRLGFSPERGSGEDGPITYWVSNWGKPPKQQVRLMLWALQTEFPNRLLVAYREPAQQNGE